MRKPALAEQEAFAFDVAEEQGEGIDLRHYWRMVWRRKWIILGLTLLVAQLTAMWANTLTPVYSASAKMLLELEQRSPVKIQEFFDTRQSINDLVQTHTTIMTTREVAEKLVNRLKLHDHALFTTAPERRASWRDQLPTWLGGTPAEVAFTLPPEEVRRARAVGFVRGGLGINPDRDSRVINVSFRSTDRKLAAQIPNAFVEVYVEYDLDSKLKMTSTASSWLMDRLGSLRKNLETSEQTLQSFREASNIVSKGSSGDSEMVGRLTAQLGEARQARIAAEARRSRSGGTVRVDEVASNPALMSQPAIQQALRAREVAERDVTLLSQRYGPKHPRMRSAQAALDVANSTLQKQLPGAIASIDREYEAALARERTLERELARAKGTVLEIDRNEYELQRLEREVLSNRELYNMFLERSKESGIAADLQRPVGRLIEPANVPGRPFYPDKNGLVKKALAFGLMLGLMLAFLLEYLDNTFKGSEDVERRLGLAVLGMLPLLKFKDKKSKEALTTFENDPKGGFAEAVRTIRTGVMLSGLDDPHKVIVVTSSVPSEGKTTLAVNLAVALSHMERVLLIDGDMRRPSIGKAFGIESGSPGLSALVAGTAKATECIKKSSQEQLHVLPCGVIPPNPLELLSSKRFADMLVKLAGHYDRVVIDSAPMQAVSDAQMLSRLASAVIYVVKSDATSYHVAQQGIKRLRQIDAPLLGVVLNQLDTRKAARYYGKYGYYKGGYYGAYGYHSDSK